MKFYKNLLFLIILTNFCTADAQTNDCKIVGAIADVQNIPVKDVAVYLLRSADFSVVKFAISDKLGRFEFDDLQPGTYLVKVSGVNYITTISKTYNLQRLGTTDIGVLTLKFNNTELNQVDIVSNKPLIEIKEGKKILNVQSSAVPAGSNAFEILKNAPGVKFDSDNNISLDGKNNVVVLIDNKPTYMPQEALIDMLQGMPGNMIKQIELVNVPGAKYDAASGGGMINIRLIRNQAFGINGSASIDNGLQQIENGHGSKYRFGSLINFNSRTKNLNVFGNYSYSYIPFNRILLTDRLINYNNTLTEINANYFSDQSKSSNTYLLGADYNITPTQVIGFLIRGLTNQFTLGKNTNTDIYNNSVIDSTVVTNSALNSTSSQIAYDLNYKGNFSKTSQISVDLDYFSYNRNPSETINSNYYYVPNPFLKKLQGPPYRSLTIQNSFPSNYKIYTCNVVYDVSLSPSSTLTAIAKTNYVTTHNDLNFGEVVNQVYQPDTRFTNQFDFTEHINAGAIVYSNKFNKKVNFEAGLRVEQTVSDGESITNKTGVKNNYFDLFPNVKFNDIINSDNTLLFAYGRSIYRPLYTDLNPFVAYQDQYSYYIGNPYLKPVYLNTIQLQHTYKDKFVTTLQFSVFNNFIQSTFTQNDSTKILMTQKNNLGSRYVYSIDFNDQVAFASWWNANIDLNSSYQWLTATPDKSYLSHTGVDVDLFVSQIFTLSRTVKAVLDAEYDIPTTYGINQYNAAYHVDAAVNKTINKRMGVALKVNDIFNTKRNVFASTYQNINATVNDKVDFRVIMLSFTYNFGNSAIKAERSRHTGAEPEQNRAGSGNSPQ